MKKILIIFGGASYEHEVSCVSAQTIVKNIDKNRYDVSIAGITKDQIWYTFNDEPNKLDKNWTKANITKIDNIITYLKKFDKVFPIMHGAPVENGELEGFLDLFGIPYVGSNLEASIIGYDKEITKLLLNNYAIPQIPYIIKHDNQVDNITLDYPLIVKPARCGSSIGINIANNKQELKKCLETALKYDSKAIVESFIKAREFECAVLDKDKLIVSPVGEIKSSNTFYDYEAKYEKESGLIIPANIDKEITVLIQNISKKVFKILGLKDLSRIDFLYDENNKILYFNEVNTMPGFTSISMYPMLISTLGINITDLITKLIEE